MYNRIGTFFAVVGLSFVIYFGSPWFGEYAIYLRGFACVIVGMWSIYDVLSRVQ